MKSDTIGALAKALSLAQADFKKILKTANNPFFKSKYAPLESVIEATQPALTKHGLTVSQLPNQDSVQTILIHMSGEWISSETPLCVEKKGAQGYGSALTYARRYGLSAILGCASEPDDDGNVAQKTPAPAKTSDWKKRLSEKFKGITDPKTFSDMKQTIIQKSGDAWLPEYDKYIQELFNTIIAKENSDK